MKAQCPRCQAPIEAPPGELETAALACPVCGTNVMRDAEQTVTFTQPELNRSVGNFQLLEKLGAGAFGTVFMARDTVLDRIVAGQVPRAGQMAAQTDTE